MINLTVNFRSIEVDDGTTVAAAVCKAGVSAFRTSSTGETRGPLCGMGICFDCRVTIDGVTHLRSCNVVATDGMEVVTGG